MKETEREIVEKTISGDGEAFREIIDTHKRLVYHIVTRMLANVSDHEDVCQDVFIKVYRNLNKFKHGSKLSTWIAAIAHNTCINFLKKKKVPLIEDYREGEKPADDLMADFNLPSQDAEKADTRARLNLGIARLPVQYRNILTLYHLEEMSYFEICEVTGLPEGTVKSYLFRARKLLKEALLKKYEKEELWQ
jgi:RNA polymerase sigma-70 factor (ECF subfamily)